LVIFVVLFVTLVLTAAATAAAASKKPVVIKKATNPHDSLGRPSFM
jgi:uncharacterized membrane protein